MPADSGYNHPGYRAMATELLLANYVTVHQMITRRSSAVGELCHLFRGDSARRWSGR